VYAGSGNGKLYALTSPEIKESMSLAHGDTQEKETPAIQFEDEWLVIDSVRLPMNPANK
jgi:hypothetical protein